jgi:hypothetical protein
MKIGPPGIRFVGFEGGETLFKPRAPSRARRGSKRRAVRSGHDPFAAFADAQIGQDLAGRQGGKTGEAKIEPHRRACMAHGIGDIDRDKGEPLSSIAPDCERAHIALERTVEMEPEHPDAGQAEAPPDERFASTPGSRSRQRS